MKKIIVDIDYTLSNTKNGNYKHSKANINIK